MARPPTEKSRTKHFPPRDAMWFSGEDSLGAGWLISLGTWLFRGKLTSQSHTVVEAINVPLLAGPHSLCGGEHLHFALADIVSGATVSKT